MPEILVETTVDVSEYVDVDIEDMLDDCSEKEIENAINWLKEHDYLTNEQIVQPHDLSYSEEQFYAKLDKLSELYFTISADDLEILEELLKKY